MHEGYYRQFLSVQKDVAASLLKPEMEGLQLFITGHSLGGALAITATKFLASDITGACYTFGSPPVGTVDFDSDIVTPIYRIINHVDIVPRLPNPSAVFLFRFLATITISVMELFFRPFSSIRKSKWYDKFSKMLADAQRYRQSGYGSYLVGEGTAAKLKYTVSTFDRIKWWLIQVKRIPAGEFKLMSDHSIDKYSSKLAAWAVHRKAENPKDQ